MSNALLSVKDLRVDIAVAGGGNVRAVNGVSFDLHAGRTLGIVGESGCGKSTTVMSLLGLLPSNSVARGEACFRGQNLLTLPPRKLSEIRGRHIGTIFQNPMTALDPLFTIGEQLAEPLRYRFGLRGQALRDRQLELLGAVGIPAPERRLTQYPHEMSGGMLQRIVGAMALSCDPEILIADEPTTALDPTAQAAYLEMLQGVVRSRGLAMIIVTHDLGVVARMTDEVLVMYAGRAVEHAPVRTLFDHPAHPYTRALLQTIPGDVARRSHLPTIAGQPPSLRAPIPGCAFEPRCGSAMERCRGEAPPAAGSAATRSVECWLAEAV